MQANISKCAFQKSCASAATIANDLDFLFSAFWQLAVGQAVLCLRAGKPCWVGNDPLLLTKLV